MWWKKTTFGLSFLFFYIFVCKTKLKKIVKYKHISYEENDTFFDGIVIVTIIDSRSY